MWRGWAACKMPLLLLLEGSEQRTDLLKQLSMAMLPRTWGITHGDIELERCHWGVHVRIAAMKASPGNLLGWHLSVLCCITLYINA